jgi:TRAP-type C4-dicarboxylate transport system permease small subunit
MSREIFKKVDKGLEVLLRWGSIICLVSLLSLVSAVVFVRFVPIASLGWSDEIIEFAFAWMVFLCAAALWRKGDHFSVEVVTAWLRGSKAGFALKIFLNVLSFIFLLVFTYEGALLAMKATDRSPIFEFPRTLWYMVLPISGAIMIGYTIRDLWLLFRRRSVN